MEKKLKSFKNNFQVGVFKAKVILDLLKDLDKNVLKFTKDGVKDIKSHLKENPYQIKKTNPIPIKVQKSQKLIQKKQNKKKLRNKVKEEVVESHNKLNEQNSLEKENKNLKNQLKEKDQLLIKANQTVDTYSKEKQDFINKHNLLEKKINQFKSQEKIKILVLILFCAFLATWVIYLIHYIRKNKNGVPYDREDEDLSLTPSE